MSSFFPSSWLLPCLSLRPSCPALFLPQPNTAPDKDRAKLWSPPAVICAKGIPARDLRGWGNSLLGSPFPRPSWPLVFWPHVNSWPSERTEKQHGCQYRQIYNIYNIPGDWQPVVISSRRKNTNQTCRESKHNAKGQSRWIWDAFFKFRLLPNLDMKFGYTVNGWLWMLWGDCVFHTSRKCNAVLIPTHYLRDPVVTQPFDQPRQSKKKIKIVIRPKNVHYKDFSLKLQMYDNIAD